MMWSLIITPNILNLYTLKKILLTSCSNKWHILKVYFLLLVLNFLPFRFICSYCCIIGKNRSSCSTCSLTLIIFMYFSNGPFSLFFLRQAIPASTITLLLRVFPGLWSCSSLFSDSLPVLWCSFWNQVIGIAECTTKTLKCSVFILHPISYDS